MKAYLTDPRGVSTQTNQLSERSSRVELGDAGLGFNSEPKGLAIAWEAAAVITMSTFVWMEQGLQAFDWCPEKRCFRLIDVVVHHLDTVGPHRPVVSGPERLGA